MTSSLPRRALALVTAGALLVIAVIVITMITLLPGGGREPTGGQKPTAWEVLVQRRYVDGPSRQLALDAFASIFGPIPGGRAVDADEIGTRTGTAVMRWVGPYWEELSPEQQNVVRSYVVGTPESSAGPAGPAGPHVLREPPDPATPGIRRLVDRVLRGFREDYPAVEIVEQGKRLEVRVSNTRQAKGYDVVTAPFVYSGGDLKIPNRSATEYDGCLITFYRPFLERYSATPSPVPDTSRVALVAHELFHCHQLRLLGIPGYWEMKDWIFQGSAQWAGMKYAFKNVTNLWDTTFWPKYFAPYTFNPPRRKQSLFARAEANVGFFAQLDTSLGSPDEPWTAIDKMLKKGNNEAAFNVVGSAAKPSGRRFLTEWARGFVGDATLGPEWRSTGPGLGEHFQPDPPTELALGTRTQTMAGRPAVEKRVVPLGADVEAVRITVQGWGGLAWQGSTKRPDNVIDAPQEQTQWYCLQPEKCSCRFTDRSGARSITVALTGGTRKSHFLAEAKTGDELCKQQAGGGLPGTYAGPQPNTDLHLRFEKAGNDEYTLTGTLEGSHGSTARGCQQDYGPTLEPSKARLRPQNGRYEGIAVYVYTQGKRCYFQTHAVQVTVVDEDTIKMCDDTSPTCPLYRRIDPDPAPVA
ncbi:hypothetical protein [Streptomyces sp. NBC_01443]|uniref:hypothetical protein n=1 Tax=Streptomyces sp. NBC_01443 TaxID=2903868 RepID=UPI00225177C3|nr:hypothetical protein [Streptomyces sp. NBC_01443]MCX4632789.1 hypothetical protein [Streptomyces sp. NBC_01443]